MKSSHTKVARQAVAAVLAMATPACAARSVTPAAQPVAERQLTAGLVQRDVHVGLPAAEVAAVLGSPNLVTREADGREVWIYDRLSTESVREDRTVGVGGLGSAAGASAAGILGLRAGHERSSSVTTQKTLTVVVRFDVRGSVSAVSLHASRF